MPQHYDMKFKNDFDGTTFSKIINNNYNIAKKNGTE